jgi:hypothetical protein
MKHFLQVALLFIFVGDGLISCTNSTGFERRKVLVVDADGTPIPGAATFPQPFVPGKKHSDADGYLWVYGFSPQAEFRISAPGYQPTTFKFDQQGSHCVLVKRKP